MNDSDVLKALVQTATLAVELKQRFVRSELRRAVSKALHVKQFEDTERDLAEALAPLFVEQIRDMAKRLRGLEAAFTDLSTKDITDTAASLIRQIFDPDEWHDRLVDLALPVLARKMAEVGVAFLLTLGIDVRKDLDRLPVRSYTCPGCGEAVSIKSTLRPRCYSCNPVKEVGTHGPTSASQWLEDHPDDWDALVQAMEAEGLPIGPMTEIPGWMKRAMAEQLTESFGQDYWRKIHETTGGDAERFLRRGLEEGWSIRKMAAAMAGSFQEDTGKYAKVRATNVARTESGNALNGARRASIDQLAEEMGPEVPMVASWLSVLGITTRDTHAINDGVPADGDGLFNVGGYRVPWPAHYELPPGERCHCQCTLTTEFGMDDDEARRLVVEHEERLSELE